MINPNTLRLRNMRHAAKRKRHKRALHLHPENAIIMRIYAKRKNREEMKARKMAVEKKRKEVKPKKSIVGWLRDKIPFRDKVSKRT